MATNPLEELVDQPKKPAPTRDISDLKARLGLAKPGAAPMPGAPVPGGPPSMRPGSVPTPTPPGPGMMPGAAPARGAAPQAYAPTPTPPAPAAPDPYASFRQPAGRQFDLRSVDDGLPVQSVRNKGGVGSLVLAAILLLVGLGVGFLSGGVNVGRNFHNQANVAAKSVKVELDSMQKTLSQVGTALAMSQQRLQAAHQDPLAYDAKLIDDLDAVKLGPRPDTTRIFRVNYYLLPDVAVDRLMNYYYDTQSLYGEVERHVKKTHADKESLEGYAKKQTETAEKGTSGNYGIVFDSTGKLVIGNLVEVGKPVCKGGAEECPVDQMDGFQIRANTGSNWSPRKAGGKLDMGNVVPLKPTPLMDAVMSGSPEQVRAESYKVRYAKIRELVARLTQTQKELVDAVNKAATRPDLFAF